MPKHHNINLIRFLNRFPSMIKMGFVIQLQGVIILQFHQTISILYDILHIL